MLLMVTFVIAGTATLAADTHKHTWEVYSGYHHVTNTKKHARTYKCSSCGATKEVENACQFYTSSIYYDNLGSKHQKISRYICFDCGYSYEGKSKPASHSYKWIKVASYVKGYICGSCHTTYTYKKDNISNALYDVEYYSHCSVKKNKTEIINNFLSAYHSTKNPVVSITYSKKGICKVTHKGNKFTIKGLKKGTCNVKVKSKSGCVSVICVRVN